MFCGECGREIPDNSKVCLYCGTRIENNEQIEQYYGGDNHSAGNNIYDTVFIEPYENYIGSLGDGYLNSFLTARKIHRCVALLSDKRIYLRGNMIDNASGKISRINISKTIDLEDITGTGFIYASPAIGKLITSILLFVITIIPLICAIVFQEMIFMIAMGSLFFPLIIAAIILLVLYFKSRKSLFFIEYAGGCIKFNASIYGLVESKDFEKQIRRAKNKLKENI